MNNWLKNNWWAFPFWKVSVWLVGQRAANHVAEPLFNRRNLSDDKCNENFEAFYSLHPLPSGYCLLWLSYFYVLNLFNWYTNLRRFLCSRPRNLPSNLVLYNIWMYLCRNSIYMDEDIDVSVKTRNFLQFLGGRVFKQI